MFRLPARRFLAAASAACILVLCRPLPGHTGHDETPPKALPAWHLSDGRVLRGTILKANDDQVWIVDASDKLVTLPTADLKPADRDVIALQVSHVRAVNRVVATPNLAAVLTGLVAADAPKTAMPEAAKPFQAFARVKTRWDEQFLYVESNGMPDHPMMKGITAWQQQVPIPQQYTGDNAWRVPLVPVPAKTPVSIKGRFLRGAIALAANGIPIFNPQNNRGEVSQEIGELDEWGGHCGRADDYHYHAAPLHLQSVLKKGQPIAYALDGYPIYGLTEPDGAQPAGLDSFNGHTTALGYHYHASTKYPYINGGFHGEVVERGGQVDPQPRATPVRPDLPPMRDAKITDFQEAKPGGYTLTYDVRGKTGTVSYMLAVDGSAKFTFVDTSGNSTTENYTPRRGGGGGGGRGPGGQGGPGGEDRPPQPGGRNAPVGDAAEPRRDEPRGPGARPPEPRPGEAAAVPATDNSPKKPVAGFVLKSPEVAADGVLPKEFTGDGASATLPLEWAGAPAGTQSYAVIMHHIDPQGMTKWYWTLYNIPATTRSLPKNVKGVGNVGTNSVNDRVGYAPPHSKGPGEKTYVLTLYALSAPLKVTVPADRVNRAVLLDAMKDLVLGTAEMKVTYTRPGNAGEPQDGKRPPERNGPGEQRAR